MVKFMVRNLEKQGIYRLRESFRRLIKSTKNICNGILIVWKEPLQFIHCIGNKKKG